MNQTRELRPSRAVVGKTLISVLAFILANAWSMALASASSPLEQQSDLGTSKDFGRVIGTVSVSGAYQRPPPLRVFKNLNFCGSTVPNETLLVGREGGLRNAVVTLRPVGRTAIVQPGQYVLDNQQCAFVPHVQVAPVGSDLLLKNSDPILHTVHARMGKETLFNVGLPRWRQVTKTLNRAGIIRIDCDVLHTWMSAAIVVTSSPYFAITDGDGLFAVNHLPVGAYELGIWHEKLGTKTARISVSQNIVISVEVVYTLNEGKR